MLTPPLTALSRFSSKAAIAMIAASAATLACATTAQAATTWTLKGGNAIIGSSDVDLAQLEGSTGKKANLIRRYAKFGDTTPDARERELASQGRMLHVSIRSGDRITWKSIAAGNGDGYYLTQFKALYALPTKTFITLDHEVDSKSSTVACSQPDNATVCGPEFKAAWNHLRQLAKSNGLDSRLFWTWNATSYGLRPGTGVRAAKYYPGTANLDWVSFDIYDGSCDTGTSTPFGSINNTKLVRDWIATNAPGVPNLVPETGTTVDSAQASYLQSIGSTFKNSAYSQFKGFEYWNSGVDGCDYNLTGNAPALTAFQTLLKDPYFGATDVVRVTT